MAILFNETKKTFYLNTKKHNKYEKNHYRVSCDAQHDERLCKEDCGLGETIVNF